MSYCDGNARTGLEWKMTKATRLKAELAAQIGRCSSLNSTALASRRRLSLDKMTCGADRTYHSPTGMGEWRSVAVRELSITQGSFAAEQAYHTTSSSQQRGCGERERRVPLERCQLCFCHIVTSEESGNTMRGSA
jgi:hypothetical protein